MQAEAFAKKDELGETVEEIRERLNPEHIRQQVSEAVSESIHQRPNRWALGSIMIGAASGVLLGRKSRHHHLGKS